MRSMRRQRRWLSTMEAANSAVAVCTNRARRGCRVRRVAFGVGGCEPAQTRFPGQVGFARIACSLSGGSTDSGRDPPKAQAPDRAINKAALCRHPPHISLGCRTRHRACPTRRSPLQLRRPRCRPRLPWCRRAGARGHGFAKSTRSPRSGSEIDAQAAGNKSGTRSKAASHDFGARRRSGSKTLSLQGFPVRDRVSSSPREWNSDDAGPLTYDDPLEPPVNESLGRPERE